MESELRNHTGSQDLKDSILGLMLCYCSCESLSFWEQEASLIFIFHLAL